MQTLQTIILLFLATLSVRANPSMEIEVKVNKCKLSIKGSYKVKIYKDDIFYKEVLFTKENLHKVKLVGLETGHYKFEYINTFDRTQFDTISINEDKNYSKNIYIDDYGNPDTNYRGYIDSLKENETYRLTFFSSGCFHNISREIEFVKTKNQITATLYPEEGSTYEKSDSIKKITLNQKQIERLRFFEQEIFINCRGQYCGCTTVDVYELSYKYRKKTFGDGSCNWRGFDKLIKELFGKKE